MFGSAVLDTAIGLIFVFLLVSMLVTIANELISAGLQSRGKWLKKGIDRLLGGDFAKSLYMHPLIEGTAATKNGAGPSYIASRTFANVLLDVIRQRDDFITKYRSKLQGILDDAALGINEFDSLKKAIDKEVSDLATLISHPELKKDMALLLANYNKKTDFKSWLDEVGMQGNKLTDNSLIELKTQITKLVTEARNLLPTPSDATTGAGTVTNGQSVKSTPTSQEDINKTLEEFKKIIASVPYVQFAEAVKHDLGGLAKRLEAGYTIGDAKADLKRFIDAMPARYLRQSLAQIPDPVGKTLTVLFDDSENNIEKFKENVETWFNNSMDRVSGWYKRRSQWVILVLSLALTMFMNVDALLIVRHLETHPGVRDSLVAQAKAYATSENNSRAAAAPATPSSAAASSATNPSPVKIESGDSYSGTIPLGSAISSDADATIASSDESVTVKEKTVRLRKGAAEVEFTVDTKAAPTAKDVKISVVAGTSKGSATLHIEANKEAKFAAVQKSLQGLNLPIGWILEKDDELAKPASAPSTGSKDTTSAAKPQVSSSSVSVPAPKTSQAQDATSSPEVAASRAKATESAAAPHRTAPTQADRDNRLVWSLEKLDDIVMFHLLGWLLTALAATLGAPFWFDTLNRFISIRSSGKAPEEEPKAPKEVSKPVEPGQSPQQADFLSALRHR